MTTKAGEALLRRLMYPYTGSDSVPLHKGQPERTRRIVRDTLTRELSAIEAEAAAQERARLRDAFDLTAEDWWDTDDGVYIYVDAVQALLADPEPAPAVEP